MKVCIKTVALAAASAIPGFVGPVLAHHSSSMFVLSEAIWVEGTLVEFERMDPYPGSDDGVGAGIPGRD